MTIMALVYCSVTLDKNREQKFLSKVCESCFPSAGSNLNLVPHNIVTVDVIVSIFLYVNYIFTQISTIATPHDTHYNKKAFYSCLENWHFVDSQLSHSTCTASVWNVQCQSVTKKNALNHNFFELMFELFQHFS